MNEQSLKMNSDILKKIAEAEAGKSESISIVPEYLRFEKENDSFTGALIGVFTRDEADPETGEMKTTKYASFMSADKKVHETMSAFITQRLENVATNTIVKLIYKGEQDVKTGKNKKVKIFEILIFA